MAAKKVVAAPTKEISNTATEAVFSAVVGIIDEDVKRLFRPELKDNSEYSMAVAHYILAHIMLCTLQSGRSYERGVLIQEAFIDPLVSKMELAGYNLCLDQFGGGGYSKADGGGGDPTENGGGKA